MNGTTAVDGQSRAQTDSCEVPAPGALQRAVGRNVRRYRREHGLSQGALAERLGVHRTYMGGVERGERNLTLRSLERIADTLGLDPRDLLADGVENE